MGYAMPAEPLQLPPLPSSGGSYELSADGHGWVCTQFTAPAGAELAAEPDLAPEPEPEAPDYDSPVLSEDADPAEVGDDL
jgi:hypothetical protein